MPCLWMCNSSSNTKNHTLNLHTSNRLLLKSTVALLQSRNSAVVLTVASLYFHVGPSSEFAGVVKALTRIARSRCLPAHHHLHVHVRIACAHVPLGWVSRTVATSTPLQAHQVLRMGEQHTMHCSTTIFFLPPPPPPQGGGGGGGERGAPKGGGGKKGPPKS